MSVLGWKSTFMNDINPNKFWPIFAQQGAKKKPNLPKKKLKFFYEFFDFPPNTDILNYGNDKIL
jgi:hypothetical protein